MGCQIGMLTTVTYFIFLVNAKPVQKLIDIRFEEYILPTNVIDSMFEEYISPKKTSKKLLNLETKLVIL